MIRGDDPRYRLERSTNAQRARAAASARRAAQHNPAQEFDWDRAIELFKQRRRRR